MECQRKSHRILQLAYTYQRNLKLIFNKNAVP